MLTQKVLLPGVSVLERFVARLRERVEVRLCRLLGSQLTSAQQTQLEALLQVPPGTRYSPLERLHSGPVSVSGQSLVRALERLRAVRDLGITMPDTVSISPSRIAVLEERGSRYQKPIRYVGWHPLSALDRPHSVNASARANEGCPAESQSRFRPLRDRHSG